MEMTQKIEKNRQNFSAILYVSTPIAAAADAGSRVPTLHLGYNEVLYTRTTEDPDPHVSRQGAAKKIGGQKRGHSTRSLFVSKKDDPHVQLKKHRIIPLYGHAGRGNFLTRRSKVLTKCENFTKVIKISLFP